MPKKKKAKQKSRNGVRFTGQGQERLKRVRFRRIRSDAFLASVCIPFEKGRDKLRGVLQLMSMAMLRPRFDREPRLIVAGILAESNVSLDELVKLCAHNWESLPDSGTRVWQIMKSVGYVGTENHLWRSIYGVNRPICATVGLSTGADAWPVRPRVVGTGQTQKPGNARR